MILFDLIFIACRLRWHIPEGGVLFIEPVCQALQVGSSFRANRFDGHVGESEVNGIALQCLFKMAFQGNERRFFAIGDMSTHQFTPVMLFQQFLEATMHQVATYSGGRLWRCRQAI